MGYFQEAEIDGEWTATFDVAAMFAATGRESPFTEIRLVVHADSAISFLVTRNPSAPICSFDPTPRQGNNTPWDSEEDPPYEDEEAWWGRVEEPAQQLPYPAPRLCWANAESASRYNPFVALANQFVRYGEVEDESLSPVVPAKAPQTEDSGKRRRYKSPEVAEMVRERMCARFAARWWNALWRRALPHIDPKILKESRRFSQDLIYHNLRLRHKAFGQLVTTCPAAALLLVDLFQKTHVREDLACVDVEMQVALFEEFAGVYLRAPLPILIGGLAPLHLQRRRYARSLYTLPDELPMDLSRSHIEFIRRVQPYEAAGWGYQTVWDTALQCSNMVVEWEEETGCYRPTSSDELDICHLRQLKGLLHWKGFRAVYANPTLATVYLRNPDRALKTLREARLMGPVCGNRLRKWMTLMHQVEDYLRRPDAEPEREKKMSLETLIRHSEEWHRAGGPPHVGAFRFPVGPPLSEKPFAKPWIPNFEKDGLRLIFLPDPKALREESMRMHHCVWSYAERVHRGECQIYSVRDTSDGPIGTIELRPSFTVAQAKGKHNQPLPQHVQEFIREAVAAGRRASGTRLEANPPLPVSVTGVDALIQYMRNLRVTGQGMAMPMPALVCAGWGSADGLFAECAEEGI